MSYLVLTIGLLAVAYGMWTALKAPEKNDVVRYVGQADGTRAMVCKACSVHLVTVQRQTSSGVVSALAWLLGLAGVLVLMFNLLLGAALLILAVLVGMAGRGTQAVMRCPSCGAETKI